ncbi:MAG: ribonuclease [Deltaproteobacteria bacterium]|nr:ribonuclease [Deltaproteobacteria bacterium]
MKKITSCSAILIFFIWICLFLPVPASAESCEKVVQILNARLVPKIDERELIEILRSLNRSNDKQLPPKFVTKQEARSRGWKPGRDLWSLKGLRGASMGGDRFRNLEGRLPENKWREADLDYKGGHRGAKRLIFSRDGKRFVTVNHYRTFTEVPSCR